MSAYLATHVIANDLQAAFPLARAFGVGGANIEDMITAWNRAASGKRAPFVLAKHEFNAANMADGHAQATRTPGIVLATSGGSALNLIPALAESFSTRTPVLALVGEPPIVVRGTEAFQETSGQAETFDIAQLFTPISRLCRRIESQKDWDEAYPLVVSILTDPRKTHRGPVVLILPKDVQKKTWELRPSPTRPVSRTPVVSPDEARLCDWLLSVRPTLIVGEDIATPSLRKKVAQMAEKLQSPVTVTGGGKAAFSSHHPLFAGMTGVLGDGRAREAIESAEGVFVIGSRLPGIDRFGIEDLLKNKEAFTLGLEHSCLNGKMVSVVTDNLEASLERVNQKLPSNGRPSAKRPPLVASPTPAHQITLPRLASLLQPLLDRPGVSLAMDAGNATAATVTSISLGEDAHFLMARHQGGMGFTLGASIGAALAENRPVVALIGDGSFFMHGMEIHTAIEHHAPVLFVIFDNHAHAMCVTRDEIFFDIHENTPHLFHTPTHLGAGLQAMFPTLPVKCAASETELVSAVNSFRNFNGPSALVIQLDPLEFPPFLPFKNAKPAGARPHER